jgi:hypothetical protein
LLAGRKHVVGSSAYADIGMDALERLARTMKLSPEGVKINSISLENGYLDIVPGWVREDRDYRDRMEDAMPAIFHMASLYYDAVLTDLSGSDSKLREKLLRQSQAAVIVLRQDMNELERFFSKADWEAELYGVPSLFVLDQYDSESKYTAANIRRHFGLKQQVYALPYCTGYRDSYNDRDVLSWMRRQTNAGRKQGSYEFVQSLKKLSRAVLEAIDVNPDSKAAERGVI